MLLYNFFGTFSWKKKRKKKSERLVTVKKHHPAVFTGRFKGN